VFSPDGKEIWTSQMNSGKVLVLDASTYQIKRTITVGREPAEVTFSADGSKAYVANGGDDNVSIIDPTTKNILQTVAVGHNPVAAWVGYDGRMYVDNEEGKSVSVIDVTTNAVIETIALQFMPGSVAHHRQGKELWVTAPELGKVYYWTWNTQQAKWITAGNFVTGNGAHAIAFTSDGGTAYVTNQLAHTVSVIDVASHTKIKDIAVGKKPNGIVLKY
jgi:YVTN family beta-propeller protein